MNANLQKIAEILLKEHFDTFEALLLEFKSTDKLNFFLSHKKMLQKSDYDIEDIQDVDEFSLFLIYAKEIKRLYFVDWSGEEYSGQITKSIRSMLKNYDQNCHFNWNQKKFNSKFMKEIKRGEYVPLLLSEMNKVLSLTGYQITIFYDYSDTYSYCILSTEDMQEIVNISDDNFAIIDTKIYVLYLLKEEHKNSKLLIYLKKKFNLSLHEVKDFSMRDRILLSKGNYLTVMEEKEKIEKLDAKWLIDEIT